MKLLEGFNWVLSGQIIPQIHTYGYDTGKWLGRQLYGFPTEKSHSATSSGILKVMEKRGLLPFPVLLMASYRNPIHAESPNAQRLESVHFVMKKCK